VPVIHVKPKAGSRVRDPADPNKAPLPHYGKAVESSPYWARRLAAGEVEPTTAQAVEKGEQAAAAAHRKQAEEEAARRAAERKQAQSAQADKPVKPAAKGE
jgi:hypothetical protein